MIFSRLTQNGITASTIFLAFAGCSTTGEMGEQEPLVTSESTLQSPASVDFIPKGTSPEEIDAALATVDKAAEKPAFVESDVGDEISHATTEGIPMEINADVERWLDFFTMKDRDRFKRFLERGSRYKNMINTVLKEQGVPTELYYQAMIESGFAVHATSIASAVGIWQFIPQTGRRYGLRIDHYVDERRDPMRATIAASRYLKDLYNVFQNWYLAMAAYNAGEGRILGAIMRSNTRDFWEMVQKRTLPAETMNYIPKFLAATTIGHNLERYGFEDMTPEIAPQLVAVPVPSPVRISDIARVSGVPLAMINEYNPHIRRGVTPPGQSTYKIWVPRDYQDKLNSKQDQLTALRIRRLEPVALAASSRTKVHRVRSGENLTLIAGKYNVSVRELKKLNSLRSDRLYAGMRLKVVATKPVASAKAHTTMKYRVKRGDNLHKIAKKFNTSIPELKKLNNLKRSSVAIGQVLKVNDRKG